ncbi:hypothetical protein Mal48_40210 [Thalassoglobus polymorphus]|uniref:Uncharacterized protein n=1 Tax=Thalassoglobus polymorphus TaxID=2527994 RepID=A0A517QSZ5_9PLAN|nr:hypothetical protein Mal48_40210 [Thalassoglobus polymorphus]
MLSQTLRKAAIPEVFGLVLEKCVLHGHTVKQTALAIIAAKFLFSKEAVYC